MSKIIGIDLGTTNSVASVMQGGKPKILTNAQGGNLTPSVVAVDDKGETLVGEPAKNQAVMNPKNTLSSIKRLIGRRWGDKEVEKTKKLMPFELRKDEKSEGVEIKMGDKWYKPQEISAKVLQKIKSDAEQFLGEDIVDAVITVPAYFDDSQRQATKEAGKIAGLTVKRIVNEPTAAALAYGFDKDRKDEQQLAVFDLGGGTFDISILEVGDGVYEVLATNGDTFLGGDDFDQAIIDMLVKEFEDAHGIDLKEDKTALQRLKEAAEKAKIELSQAQETEINIPFITADKKGPKHLQRKFTRSELEKITADLIDRLKGPCEKVVEDAGIEMKDVDDILLVGGMTRMPAVKKAAESIFGKKPKEDINPDEVVSAGAAIQAGVLGGDVTDIQLVDVTPLSLGIETMGGVTTKLVDRNTTIPVEKSKVFTTAADNQPAVEVHVVQGEREMAEDNKTLGKFILDGIPPSPRGVPQIEVTFKIDSNGILNVTAKDKATGKEQHITITASTGLSEDDVDKLVKEAAAHASEDKKKKEWAQLRNDADTLAFSGEKLLKDLGDKVDKKKKEEVEKLIKEIRDQLSKEEGKVDKDKLKNKKEDLEKILQEIGAEAYKAASEKVSKAGAKSSSKDENKKTKGEEKKKPGDDETEAQEGEVVK